MLANQSLPKSIWAQIHRRLKSLLPARPQEEGFDVRWLTPTPPMTEEEITERYRQARVAEIGL
jgi:hypothetical protein